MVLVRFTFKSLNNSLRQQRNVPLLSINWLFWQHRHFLKNKTQSVTLKQDDPVGRNRICTCFTVTQGVNNHPTTDDWILQHLICSAKCGWHHFLPTLIEYRCWFILVDEEKLPGRGEISTQQWWWNLKINRRTRRRRFWFSWQARPCKAPSVTDPPRGLQGHTGACFVFHLTALIKTWKERQLPWASHLWN